MERQFDTTLYFACDGSDLGFHKVEIVKQLLAARAEIEATDAKDSTLSL